MITGELNQWQKVSMFKNDPIWTDVFTWLEKNWSNLPLGDQPLPFGGCIVRVMEYGLKSRNEARFESHLHTIDLQITLEGAEGIEWMPVSKLEVQGEYKPEKDFQFYQTPAAVAGRIDNLVGNYCVLFPGDGHMPQLTVDDIDKVKKLVVKIPAAAVLK